ncbi:MAG: ABC transporter permease, partial [Epsilonproteobacteria bacterium]|nr:ABC transporter permease [Campylobacterota bacterium]
MIIKEMNNLKLSFEFAKRDLKERYAGTSFGHLWLVISPFVTIVIYTVIFSDFMKMKLNVINSEYSYSIYLIPGLLSWNFFSTTVLRLSNAIFEKANILKKISIPMYVYYISIVISEFIVYIIGMIFGVLFLVVVNHHVGIEFVVLPVYMLMVMFFAFFLGVILSLFTPFFRDLREIINVILQLW